MTLYLYALAEGIERIDGVTGVCGETPVVLALSSCQLVAGWIEARPALDRESLIKQDALVRRIHHSASAVLPIRFATCVADTDAAARAVDAFGATVRERLELVRGREQMTLRTSGASSAWGPSGASSASGAASASVDSGEGRRYLERRACKRTPAELQPMLQALEPLQRAVRVESVERSAFLTVYHLIDRGRSAAYVEAATRTAGHLPQLKVRISGPAPAYAFADLGRLR